MLTLVLGTTAGLMLVFLAAGVYIGISLGVLGLLIAFFFLGPLP